MGASLYSSVVGPKSEIGLGGPPGQRPQADKSGDAHPEC